MTVESQEGYFRFIDTQGVQLVGKDSILDPLKLYSGNNNDGNLGWQLIDESIY